MGKKVTPSIVVQYSVQGWWPKSVDCLQTLILKGKISNTEGSWRWWLLSQSSCRVGGFASTARSLCLPQRPQPPLSTSGSSYLCFQEPTISQITLLLPACLFLSCSYMGAFPADHSPSSTASMTRWCACACMHEHVLFPLQVLQFYPDFLGKTFCT